MCNHYRTAGSDQGFQYSPRLRMFGLLLFQASGINEFHGSECSSNVKESALNAVPD